MFSNRDKAKEARREIGYRQFVYSKKVAEGSMKVDQATVRIALMTEIAEDYERLAEHDEREERLL